MALPGGGTERFCSDQIMRYRDDCGRRRGSPPRCRGAVDVFGQRLASTFEIRRFVSFLASTGFCFILFLDGGSVVHPRGDRKYAQSIEATGDRGATWRM